MPDNRSESNQTSTQASYDQRNAADNGAIVVGQGSSYTVNFPEQAESIISKALDFSGKVVTQAGSLIDSVLQGSEQTNQQLIASTNQIKSQENLGTASLIKDLIPVLAVGAVGLIIFLSFRR